MNADVLHEAAHRIGVDGFGDVSALTLIPIDATAVYVFGHGAGAGMRHPFMAAFAEGLAARRIATLRYQFPFTERGSRRPDSPAMAHAAVRAAVTAAAQIAPSLPLVAGGKSFGGRMTSQAQAALPMPGVRGLAFVGFPLHPVGKPGVERAAHLADVKCPMLFLQGTRDALADVSLVAGVVDSLGSRATIAWFDDADHAFHVRAKSGHTDAKVREAMLDAFEGWMRAL